MCLFLLFFNPISNCKAQGFTTPLHSNFEFSGLIQPKNGKRIKSDTIILHKEFVLFKNKNNIIDTLSYDKIRFVNAFEGNNAVEGSLVGAVLFLGLDVFLDVIDDYEINNPPETVAVYTAVGAGLGLIFGLLSKKQRTVYRNEKMNVVIFENNSYNMNFTDSNLSIIKLCYFF